MTNQPKGETMYLGPVGKPFHKAECQCTRCCQWMVDKIAELEAEVERLQRQLRNQDKRANNHSLVMKEGGTDGIDRCHRVINKLDAKVHQLREPTWYWDERDLDHAVDPVEATAYDDVGDILELRPLHELPRVWALVTDDGPQFFDTHDAAEAAKEKE